MIPVKGVRAWTPFAFFRGVAMPPGMRSEMTISDNVINGNILTPKGN